MKHVKEAASTGETEFSIAVLQALEEDLDMGLTLGEGAVLPFCRRRDASGGEKSRWWRAGRVREGRTGEVTLLPRGQVLRDLRHLDVGIELFELIEDGVFVVVAEVIV